MKKVLSLALALAMALTVMSFSVIAADSGANNEETAFTPVDTNGKTTVEIDGVTYTVIDELSDITAAGNYILANDINGDTDTSDAVVPTELTEALVTIPAGTVLDGNGHAIYNYVNVVDGAGVSMFVLGETAEEGKTITIKNLTIGQSGNPIKIAAAGAAALFADGATYTEPEDETVTPELISITPDTSFDNCHFYADVTLTESANGGVVFGQSVATGLTFTDCTLTSVFVQEGAWSNGMWLGQVDNADVTMTNCVSNGSIEVKDAGQAAGFIAYPKKSVTMTDCVNNATVTAGQNAGGLVAQISYSKNVVVTFDGCVNNGDIESKTTSTHRAGGIAAYAGNCATLTVKDCVNNGNVIGTAQVGAVIGYIGDTTTAELVGCVNNGNATATGSKGAVGGIFAQAYNVATLNLTDCTNNGTVTGNATEIGGIAGVTQKITDLTFMGCTNAGKVTEGASTAATMCALGGMIARPNACSNSFELIACVNSGDIVGNASSTTNRHGGGMLGNTYNVTKTTTIEMDNCVNIGTIRGLVASSERLLSVIDCANYGNINAADAGGLIGVAKSYAATVTNCVNYGTINGSRSGGAFGQITIASNINGFVNEGDLVGDTCGGLTGNYSKASTVSNVINLGDITSNTNGGGFVGWGNATLTLTNCANVSKITSSNRAGNVAGNLTAAITLDGFYAFGTLSANTDTPINGGTGAASLGTNGASYLDSYTSTIEGGTAVDEAGAIAALEEAFGVEFIICSDGTFNFAVPVVRGVQNTKAVDGAQKIRFLATIFDYEAYDKAGFKVTRTYTSAIDGEKTVVEPDFYCQYVYTSVTGSEDDGTIVTTSAQKLGGEYIFAMVVEDVPTNIGTIVFEVTAFVTDGEGDSAVTYESQTVRITYENGVCTGYGYVVSDNGGD